MTVAIAGERWRRILFERIASFGFRLRHQSLMWTCFATAETKPVHAASFATFFTRLSLGAMGRPVLRRERASAPLCGERVRADALVMLVRVGDRHPFRRVREPVDLRRGTFVAMFMAVAVFSPPARRRGRSIPRVADRRLTARRSLGSRSARRSCHCLPACAFRCPPSSARDRLLLG
jgi:hypothetical protein